MVLSEEEDEDIGDEEMNTEADAEESKTTVEPKKVAVKEVKKETKSEPEVLL